MFEVLYFFLLHTNRFLLLVIGIKIVIIYHNRIDLKSIKNKFNLKFNGSIHLYCPSADNNIDYTHHMALLGVTDITDFLEVGIIIVNSVKRLKLKSKKKIVISVFIIEIRIQ